MRTLAAAFAAVVLLAAPAAAQAPQPIPRFVVDVQGVFGGLPATEGWVPVVPADTPIPGHGLGFAGGAHVYLFKMGVVTFGAGANMMWAKRAGSPLTTEAGDEQSPAVTTAVTHLNPQLSLNFGHRLGWSYLSGGYGASKVTSTSTAYGSWPAQSAPEAWNPSINYGGGARWFMKPHLAVNFDIRITQLATREATATEPFALRAKTVSFLVGVSFQ